MYRIYNIHTQWENFPARKLHTYIYTRREISDSRSQSSAKLLEILTVISRTDGGHRIERATMNFPLGILFPPAGRRQARRCDAAGSANTMNDRRRQFGDF